MAGHARLQSIRARPPPAKLLRPPELHRRVLNMVCIAACFPCVDEHSGHGWGKPSHYYTTPKDSITFATSLTFCQYPQVYPLWYLRANATPTIFASST